MNQELPEIPAAQNQKIVGLQTALLVSPLDKPGYKTTEFYIALLAVVGHIAGIQSHAIPGETGCVSLTATTLAYIAARAFIKQFAAQHPRMLPVLAQAAQFASAAAEIQTAQADTPATSK